MSFVSRRTVPLAASDHRSADSGLRIGAAAGAGPTTLAPPRVSRARLGPIAVDAGSGTRAYGRPRPSRRMRILPNDPARRYRLPRNVARSRSLVARSDRDRTPDRFRRARHVASWGRLLDDMGMGMVGNPNDDALFTLIQTLTELPGPTGHEDAVQDWIADRWSSLGEVRRTNVGNVLVRVGGRGPRLVLVAHADEICLVIKSVSDEGHCFVWPYYADRLGAPPRWFMPAASRPWSSPAPSPSPPSSPRRAVTSSGVRAAARSGWNGTTSSSTSASSAGPRSRRWGSTRGAG